MRLRSRYEETHDRLPLYRGSGLKCQVDRLATRPSVVSLYTEGVD